ncbi:Pre-mRNA-splicing regulator WTAP [Symbiodinium microadriaticum]|uniref:Pre-mRNA-splicing regulator WTAP n=1 Tax=Symbiodinium microadriaticum TaxID=2951 RepID=A0A1Q9C4X6_SYMMI|nr:Pre-mRNA-splicing regulator WTAP [Symbiodinium microadriaticum]
MASADGEGDITERIMEFQRREYAMLSRLAQREREMTKLGQECAEAFYAFDDNRKDSLRGGYVDPAVNIEITLLRQRLREKDQEISQVREELQNAQFQPNSIQGKKLLDKCQHLMEENAEIARQLSEEKMQVLRIQLAAERRKRLQLRQRSAFLDRYAEQADQENEKMEKKITDLGQSLKETRAEIEKHKKEMEEGKSGKRKQREAAPAAAEPTPQAEAKCLALADLHFADKDSLRRLGAPRPLSRDHEMSCDWRRVTQLPVWTPAPIPGGDLHVSALPNTVEASANASRSVPKDAASSGLAMTPPTVLQASQGEAPAKKRKKEKKDKSKQKEQAVAPPAVVEQPPEQEPPAEEEVEKKRRKEKKKDKEKKVFSLAVLNGSFGGPTTTTFLGEEEGEVSRSTKALLCEVSVLLHRQVPEPPES